MRNLNRAVAAAIAAAALFTAPVLAEQAELEALFEGLRTADPVAAEQIEARIYEIWSQSGSDAMDLLLTRGREALSEGDTRAAIEHFTALTDHAPEFAEGWNARATAYFHAGQYGPSLDAIRRTLALNPRHFGAMSGLALILEEMGAPEAALEVWREVEKIIPNRDGLAATIKRLEREIEGEAI